MVLEYLILLHPQLRRKLRVREVLSVDPRLVDLLDTPHSSLMMPSVSSFFLFFPSQSLFLHNTGNFMGISSVSRCTLNSKGTWMLARCSIHCVATPLLPPPSSPPWSSESHCLKLYTDHSSEKMYRWLASISKEAEHW